MAGKTKVMVPPKQSGPIPQEKSAGVEWVGGVVSASAYTGCAVTSVVHDMLLWMGADGTFLGSTAAIPGELMGVASQSLADALTRPMVGRSQVPGRVRVANPELAEALRVGHPGIDVVCAPTPEMDAALGHLLEDAKTGTGPLESYLSPAVKPEVLAAFFRATAALYLAKPWMTVPSDLCLFSVTCQELGLQRAALSVVGQQGDFLGWALFAGVGDFDTYLEASESAESGELLPFPPHLVLSFERASELTPSLRSEIASHGWMVACPEANPRLLAVEGEPSGRRPSARELATAEAIALALTEMATEKEAVLVAWNGGAALSRSYKVVTHTGEVEVVLRVPHPGEHDVASDLFNAAPGGEAESKARQAVESRLLRGQPRALDAEQGLLQLPGEPAQWIWALTCPTPQCGCRTALVLSVPGDRAALLSRGRVVADAWEGQGDYERVAQGLQQAICFSIDLDTLEVFSPTGDDPLEVDAHPEIKATVERMDEDVLDAIARIWYRGKGEELPPEPGSGGASIELEGWLPGAPVLWNDVQLALRSDNYVLGENVYEALEVYSLDPKRGPVDVVVHFDVLEPAGAKSPGYVEVAGDQVSWGPHGQHPSKCLQALWAAYCTRHPGYRDRAVRRQAIVRGFAERIVPAPPKPNAGRNDPCPCGSGKKFRKCCGVT